MKWIRFRWRRWQIRRRQARINRRDFFELWDDLQSHPDFIGGQVWNRQDLAQFLKDLRYLLDERGDYRVKRLYAWGGGETPTQAEIDALTPEQIDLAMKATENYFDSRSYSWSEALSDSYTQAEWFDEPEEVEA